MTLTQAPVPVRAAHVGAPPTARSASPAARPAPRAAVRVAARSQRPVTDVVEDWGLASFPASDPPSNW